MVAWKEDFKEGICVLVIHGSCLGGLVRSDSLSRVKGWELAV